MAPTTTATIMRRQSYTQDDGDCWNFIFGCNDSNLGVRYGVTGGIIAAILILLIVGRAHALRRQRAGMPLLWYHKWMVRKRVAPVSSSGFNSYNFPGINRPNGDSVPGPWGGRHRMQNGTHATDYEMPGWEYPPPPPSYDATQPPAYYQPPQEGKGGVSVMSQPAAEGQEGQASRVDERHAQAQPVEVLPTGQSTSPVYR